MWGKKHHVDEEFKVLSDVLIQKTLVVWQPSAVSSVFCIAVFVAAKMKTERHMCAQTKSSFSHCTHCSNSIRLSFPLLCTAVTFCQTDDHMVSGGAIRAIPKVFIYPQAQSRPGGPWYEVDRQWNRRVLNLVGAIPRIYFLPVVKTGLPTRKRC